MVYNLHKELQVMHLYHRQKNDIISADNRLFDGQTAGSKEK